MKTITTLEAKTHLSRYLAAVETGEEVVIARGKKPIARLVPFRKPEVKTRPKVGQMLGEGFKVPDSAFAPMDERELGEWGL